MAIDTRDKRDSVIGIMLPFRMRLPVADGSINLADRQHVALLYRGISVTVTTAAPADHFYALLGNSASAVPRIRGGENMRPELRGMNDDYPSLRGKN